MELEGQRLWKMVTCLYTFAIRAHRLSPKPAFDWGLITHSVKLSQPVYYKYLLLLYGVSVTRHWLNPRGQIYLGRSTEYIFGPTKANRLLRECPIPPIPQEHAVTRYTVSLDLFLFSKWKRLFVAFNILQISILLCRSLQNLPYSRWTVGHNILGRHTLIHSIMSYPCPLLACLEAFRALCLLE